MMAKICPCHACTFGRSYCWLRFASIRPRHCDHRDYPVVIFYTCILSHSDSLHYSHYHRYTSHYVVDFIAWIRYWWLNPHHKMHGRFRRNEVPTQCTLRAGVLQQLRFLTPHLDSGAGRCSTLLWVCYRWACLKLEIPQRNMAIERWVGWQTSEIRVFRLA